jgi:hypothetical protein
MELDDAIRRDAVEERARVVAVIEGADVDVVDVEQEPAAGTARELGDELPLHHFRLTELHVGGDVLQAQLAAEPLLHVVDARDDMIEGLARIGDGQEIVQVHAVHTGPAQMIGDPLRLRALGELVEPVEIILVEWRGRRDRQRDAMHHHRIALDDFVEHRQRLSAGDHVVLGNDLEPVDVRIALEDVAVMRRPQTQTKAEIGRTFAVARRFRDLFPLRLGACRGLTI